jgi:thiamine monophosphate synthase
MLRAGARTIAVCSAVTESTDPAAACRALKEKTAALRQQDTLI